MFQNIQKDFNIEQEKNEGQRKINQKSLKTILMDLFSFQNIAIYVIAFMISMVGFRSQNFILSISPFGISFLAAMLSNRTPIGIVYLLTLLGTFISFGANSLLIYFLTTLVFFVFILLKRPREQEGVNEERRLGLHLFLAVLIVQIVPMFFNTFYLYDFLTSIALSIASYVFYKIFSNSLLMIKEFGKKKSIFYRGSNGY